MLTPEQSVAVCKSTYNTYSKMGCLTPENRTESLILIISNRTLVYFKKLYRNGVFTNKDILNALKKNFELITIFPSEIFNDQFLIDEIIKIIKPEYYDILPSSISILPEVRKICNPKNILTEKQRNAVLSGSYDHMLSEHCFDKESRIESLEIIATLKKSNMTKFYNLGAYDINDAIELMKKNIKLIKKLPTEILNNENFINFIVDVVEPEYYDILPYHIAKLPKVQEKCGRKYGAKQVYIYDGVYDKEGYNNEWLNKAGELRKFFKLKSNFPIRSKKDYLIIYDKYLESKLSIPQFCTKYGIDSKEDFADFLNRLSNEKKEHFENIAEVKKEAINKWIMALKNIANKIINNELTVEEFLKTYKNKQNYFSIETYLRLLSDEERRKLAHKFIEYFDRNSELISASFVTFLTEDKMPLTESYRKYIKANLVMPDDREYGIKAAKHNNKLMRADTKYYRKNMYCDRLVINNVEYVIDDEVIDQAFAYARDNDYHCSNHSMLYLCKQVAMGKIKYEKKTKEKKEVMVEEIIDLVFEETTIIDYLNYMETNYKNGSSSQKTK